MYIMNDFLSKRASRLARFTVKMVELLLVMAISYTLPAGIIALVGWDMHLYTLVVTSIVYNVAAFFFVGVIVWAYVSHDDFIEQWLYDAPALSIHSG